MQSHTERVNLLLDPETTEDENVLPHLKSHHSHRHTFTESVNPVIRKSTPESYRSSAAMLNPSVLRHKLSFNKRLSGPESWMLKSEEK